MENFSYCAPTMYKFGRGVENLAGELTRGMGCGKVMIVYGGGSAVRSGLLARVEESLRQAGVDYVDLGGVQPNPVDSLVYKGIAAARETGVDGLLAVGGGSVIDTAKAIAAGVPYTGDFWDFYCGKAQITEALPVGVVLTIPAAGSEGSGNSVITREENKQKISIRTDFLLRPRFALLDPELTYTLPAYQTASGVADMMAHIMERYFSPSEEVETTDRISEGLLKSIIEEAPKAIATPDSYGPRANIMWAGTLAHNGLCGCGRREDWTSHGLEHVLSALYGVTHGAGLAVVFPAWMTFMADHNPGKIAQLGHRVFDLPSTGDLRADALAAVSALRKFFRSIGLPATLADLGVKDPDFDRLATLFHRDKGEPFGTYYPISHPQTEAIYRLMQ